MVVPEPTCSPAASILSEAAKREGERGREKDILGQPYSVAPFSVHCTRFFFNKLNHRSTNTGLGSTTSVPRGGDITDKKREVRAGRRQGSRPATEEARVRAELAPKEAISAANQYTLLNTLTPGGVNPWYAIIVFWGWPYSLNLTRLRPSQSIALGVG